MQFQPILELVDRRMLLQEGEPVEASESQIKGGMEKVAAELLKPIHKDPHGFVAAYLEHTGRKDMTVKDLIEDLTAMAKRLEKQLHDSLIQDYGYNGEICLDEGILSSIMKTATWMGRPIAWVAKLLWGAIHWVSQSWAGKHPIGRIALGILFISLADSYYPALSTIFKFVLGRFYWIFPTTFILGISLFMVIECIKLLGRISASESIEQFVEVKNKPALNFFTYFKGLLGMGS